MFNRLLMGIWIQPENHQSTSFTAFKSDKTDEDLREKYGKTALINEAARGNIKNVLALIAAGANIDVQDLQFGKTALIEAVWRGHIDVAVALIAAGANVFIKDDNENTALIGSIWGGHTEISLALIKTCKEKCAIDVQYFEIILMAAAKRGQTEVAMALIAVGIDVNAKDAVYFLNSY